MKKKKLGIVTTGGDCPGLNACIRAAVRSALWAGCEVVGIQRGFEGLMRGEFVPLNSRSVGGIMNRGGTILLSARSPVFKTPAGMRRAAAVVAREGLEGLIVLGGNGSLKGAWEFTHYTKAAVIGIPKSIDNDIGGTDYSIGFDTAVNTAVEAIDKIRDTALSHERIFLIEVMGRDRGFLALAVAIAAGAEEVLVPERPMNIETLHKHLERGAKEGKKSSIVVVAEGNASGGAFAIARKLASRSGYQVRVSVLGYQQRGGVPSAFDRVLASRLGKAAVDVSLKGQRNKMVGILSGRLIVSDLARSWKEKKRLNPELLELCRVLAH